MARRKDNPITDAGVLLDPAETRRKYLASDESHRGLERCDRCGTLVEADGPVCPACGRYVVVETRHEWCEGPETRYGIYFLKEEFLPLTDAPVLIPHLHGVTSKEGIGTALVLLADDGDLTPERRVGILDGLEGTWLVSPFAKK